MGVGEMLLFSEYLRELLQTKQVSISALARAVGVERSTLSKVLTGQRVLPYDALAAVAYHLRLTPGETQQLRAYYDAQFEKEGIRRSREMVSQLFADMAELDFSLPMFEENRLLMDLETFAGGRSLFSGAMKVQSLLRLVLAEELARDDARLELTVPPMASFLNEELLRRYCSGDNRAEVTQIIAFDALGTAEEINLHNLACFCRVLPLCLLSQRHYHPYYYYDNSVTARYSDPFPYFLVTHGCVVCLSEDGSQAMLLLQEDQVDGYHRHFQLLLERAYSLVQYTADPAEMLMAYDAATDVDGFYMVMDQPCFGRFYDEAVIGQYLRQELPFYELLREVAMKRFGRLRQVEHFYTLFTESGLERFAATGSLDDFPTAFVAPFSPAQRRRFMEALAGCIRSGEVQGRVLRPGTFPDYLSLTTSAQSGVGFFTTEHFALQDGFCSILLREPNLCRAFHGWLTHLPDGPQALSLEASAAVLERMAAGIKKEEEQ